MAKPKALEGIQILRGLAALAVVFHHACLAVGTNGPNPGFFNSLGRFHEVGAGGVDVFFVISGFIMLYVGQNSFGKPGAAGDFWLRRLLRIVPLYWFYTTLMLLQEAPKYFAKPGTFSLAYTLKSYLFIPAYNPHLPVAPAAGPSLCIAPAPLLGTGWTLSYEMFFYLLLGTWICFGTRKTLLPFLLVCFAACLAVSYWLGWDTAIGTFLGQPLLFEFLFGVAVAYLFILDKAPGRTGSAVLVMVSAVMFLATSFFPDPIPWFWRCTFWGIPAALLVLAGAGWQPRQGWIGRGLLRLGDSSYSLYLQHAFIMLLLGALLKRGHLTSIPPDLLVLGAITVSIVGGWYSYALLEVPLNRWLQERVLASRRPLAIQHPQVQPET